MGLDRFELSVSRLQTAGVDHATLQTQWSRMRASNPRPAAFSLIATITLYQLQDRRATNCANPTYVICHVIYLRIVIVEYSVIKTMGGVLAIHGLFY